MARSAGELVRIAAAGAGLNLNASTMSPGEMVRVVAASVASGAGAQIVFTSCANKSPGDLIRVAAAGRGFVVFED